MRVQIQDGFFTVHFDHNVDFGTHNCVPASGSECRIYLGAAQPENLIATGRTRVAPGDTPNRALGRRLSLKRALQKARFDRHTRYRFWVAYFHKHKDHCGWMRDPAWTPADTARRKVNLNAAVMFLERPDLVPAIAGLP